MDIELTQQKQQQEATSSANEEQSLQHVELNSEITAQESETNPPGYNLVSPMSNSSEPQLQQQQQQQDVAININARFGPSCAMVLSDTEIVNNIIEARKRVDRHQWLYLFVACIPIFVLTCLIWIIWAATKCSYEEGWNDCSTSNFLYYFGIGLASLTGMILLWAIIYGASQYSNGGRYDRLRSGVRCVVKLEGGKWTRYVNYLYGPNGGGFKYLGNIGSMSFCCRKSHYEKLIARGYGYIVFCQQGIILDEIYHIVRNQPHIILKVVYITDLGLRAYLLRKDGVYTVRRSWNEETRRQAGLAAATRQTVQFDIFLPNTIPEPAALLLALQLQHGL